MKVKKYPQSHLVISNDTAKLLIDAGSITFAQGFTPDQFADVAAILITHTHADHMDPANIKAVALDKPVYGNADVVVQLKALGVAATEVYNREKFTAAGFTIEPIDLPHCKMRDGTEGPPNTGFLIDGVLFHPGDGDKAPAQLISRNLALPIAGPTITFDGALAFAKDVQAKVIIPIHYDYFKADPKEFAKKATPLGIEVRPLAPGEETTI